MAMNGGLNAEVEIFSRLLMLMLLQSMLGMASQLAMFDGVGGKPILTKVD